MTYPDTKNKGKGESGGQSAKLSPKEDFSQWYHELLMTGEIIDNRYPVKGMCVWFPFGFAIKKNVYGIIRQLLDPDHQETLFPLMIPENEFMKEAQHIKGFEEEVYWVTCGGTTPLEVKLALRPTSETAIYPMFKLWIRSHADMPGRSPPSKRRIPYMLPGRRRQSRWRWRSKGTRSSIAAWPYPSW